MNKIFKLHEKLEEDSFFITNLNLCSLRLSKNANFPLFILVPRINDISEIFELSSNDQKLLMSEINEIAKFCKNHFSADKINIASFGNVVKQLHIHVIARFTSDYCWPQPIWNCDKAADKYDNEQLAKIITSFSPHQ